MYNESFVVLDNHSLYADGSLSVFAAWSWIQASSLSEGEVWLGRVLTLHQTGGHHLPTQVATLPGHTHLQLTSIEFQDWGLNLGPLRPGDSKLTALTIRPLGPLCQCV